MAQTDRTAPGPVHPQDAATEAQVAPLEGLTMGAALRRSARLYGARDFVQDGETRLSFREFDAAVDRLASGLLALGIRRGEPVAIWLTNTAHWVLSFFACARIGAVVVPINTRYTAAEAGYLLAQSDAVALIMTRRIWTTDYLSLLETCAPSLATQYGAEADALHLPELPALRRLIAVGPDMPGCTHDFEQLLAGTVSPALATAESAVQVDDPMLICYTSGTTGKPKGAMHNHRVMKQATRVGLSCLLEPGGRMLGHMPLYHVAGLYMGLIPAMTLGACWVAMHQWDTAAALELIERERISCFGGIPTHFVDLTHHPSLGSRDLSSLRAAWIGGSPVMQVTFRHFMQALGLRHLLSTYGMTENTISTTFNRLDDPLEVCCENRARVLGPCEVIIADPLSGAPLPAGENGEIRCRGETVMMGYYRNPQATQETITDDGWLRTGDLGRFDENGFLSITGRLKEMYKSGGTNVYPAEIEQHLARHPAVRIASVVGVPDERLGEVGFAFVEIHEGHAFDPDVLRHHCREALAAYKIPRYVHRIDALPRTSTGKIQRSALLELATAQLATRQAVDAAERDRA